MSVLTIIEIAIAIYLVELNLIAIIGWSVGIIKALIEMQELW